MSTFEEKVLELAQGLSKEELQQIYIEDYGDAPIADDYQLAYYRVAFGQDPPAELMEAQGEADQQDVEFGSVIERALAAGLTRVDLIRLYRGVYREVYQGMHRKAREAQLAQDVGADVARIQAEVAKPITGAKRRSVPDSQIMAYRDARDRAQQAAMETYYDGLVALVKQARQTGDKTLEVAVWDVCDELDRDNPDYVWRETVEFGIAPDGELVGQQR